MAGLGCPYFSGRRKHKSMFVSAVRLFTSQEAVEVLDRLFVAADKSVSSFITHPTAVERARQKLVALNFNPASHEGFKQDSCQILDYNNMTCSLKNCIEDLFELAKIDVRQHCYNLHRYRRNDFILPHRDHTAQSVLILTSSLTDGLVIEKSKACFIRLVDKAGTLISLDPLAWHWLDPVQEPPRYTLTIRPPIPMGSIANIPNLTSTL